MNRLSTSKRHHKIWADNMKTLKKPNNKPGISNEDFGKTNIIDDLIDEYKQINENSKKSTIPKRSHTTPKA